MSEEGELVRFMVYTNHPQSSELESIFDKANERYAEQLGVKLCQGEYKVKAIVCHDWYDDGKWLGAG